MNELPAAARLARAVFVNLFCCVRKIRKPKLNFSSIRRRRIALPTMNWVLKFWNSESLQIRIELKPQIKCCQGCWILFAIHRSNQQPRNFLIFALPRFHFDLLRRHSREKRPKFYNSSEMWASSIRFSLLASFQVTTFALFIIDLYNTELSVHPLRVRHEQLLWIARKLKIHSKFSLSFFVYFSFTFHQHPFPSYSGA